MNHGEMGTDRVGEITMIKRKWLTEYKVRLLTGLREAERAESASDARKIELLICWWSKIDKSWMK